MNYYEILEVSTNASKEVIKNAYRALIKKYHPDSYTGNKIYAENKLKEINEAYEVLSDDNKRLLYDYDNGFKTDPNAPMPEVELYSQFSEYQKNNNKTENEVSDKKDDLKSKLIEIFKNKRNFAICVLLLFIVAFIFGFIISSPNNSKVKENQDEKVTESDDENDNKQDTKVDKNYNYNNYNNYNNFNKQNDYEPQNKNEYENSDTTINNKIDSNNDDNENENIIEDIPSENENTGIS